MALIKKLKRLASLPMDFGSKYAEAHVAWYLQEVIPKLEYDEVGNLYLINPWTPLVCAHMDTVQTQAEVNQLKQWVEIKYELVQRWRGKDKSELVEKIMTAPFQIWFDDKCWIAIAMELYEELWDKISLLFCVWEEHWRIGSIAFMKNHPDLLAKCTYCVIADRKNGYDLIWNQNSYCSKQFENEVLEIIWDFWYKAERWVLSDADTFRTMLNCINMSCWYYDAHTSKDWLSIDEFENCFEAMRTLVMTYNKKLPIYSLLDNTHYNTYKQSKKKAKQESLPFYNWRAQVPEDEDEEGYGYNPDKEAEKLGIDMAKRMVKLNYKYRSLTIWEEIVLMDEKFNEIVLKPGEYQFYQNI